VLGRGRFGELEEVEDTLCDVVSGDDGIAERDAVAEMPGEEETGVKRFEIGHEAAESAIADIILRDGVGVEDAVTEGGGCANAEDGAKILGGEVNELLCGEMGELGGAGSADIAGEGDVVFRGAVWEQGGVEDGAEDVEAFDLGDEHTEAVEGMNDVIAMEAENDAGDRGVINVLEWGEIELGGAVEGDTSEFMGWGGEEDSGMELLEVVLAGAVSDEPLSGGGLKVDDGGFGVDGVQETRLEGIDEFLKSTKEREFGGGLFGDLGATTSFFGAEDLAFDEGSVFLFECVEFGEGFDDGEASGVAGVDASDEGVDGVVEEFLTESAEDKLGEVFLDMGGGWADERFAEELEFGGGGEERAGDELERGGGEGDGLGTSDDVAVSGVGAGVEAAVGEAEVADEGGDDGGGFEDGVGAEFGEVAVFVKRVDDAAEAWGGLVEGEGDVMLVESEGGGEAGDAAADDGDG
jgi:hypothetical protein